MTGVHSRQVVRNSQRIVAGAASFQLGDKEKLLTQSRHMATGSTGPPLKSYIFPPTADRMDGYTHEVGRALADLIDSFPGLSLDGRLAIIVPDEPFVHALQSPLQRAIKAQFADRQLELIDARQAASTVVTGRGSKSAGSKEGIVLDTISNFDGLERLIVFAVGLDSPIAEMDTDSAIGTLQTRSYLYRALTRAHMVAVVVNDLVPGGWLEHLTVLRLRDDAEYDRELEMVRSHSHCISSLLFGSDNILCFAGKHESSSRRNYHNGCETSSWRRNEGHSEGCRDGRGAKGGSWGVHNEQGDAGGRTRKEKSMADNLGHGG